MPLRDSMDKVIGVYFACVTAESFEYQGVVYKPKLLRVSPGIFRGFTCPPMCAGCCPRFSLDYLPDEPKPEGMVLSERAVVFNNRIVTIFSDMQDDHSDHHCRNVIKTTGRCSVHGKQPFSCDFELIRFMQFNKPGHANQLTQRLFGRGWAMKRIDDNRGSLCEMTPVTDETVSEVSRKLRRLRKWCDYFGLKTKLEPIIKWADSGPHLTPLVVEN